MFVVQNKTPYVAEAVLLPDSQGKPTVTLVIKATFSFTSKGEVTLSDNQVPLFFGDEYWEKPGRSSLRYASDMVCEKKGADIAVNGHVYAPDSVPVQRIPASVTVGPVKKTIVAWGERRYTSKMGIVTRTQPLPFLKIPLRYEYAFGGSNKEERHEENPVGLGFGAKGKARGAAVPRFGHLETNPETPGSPPGFGFIAPSWKPRAAYAGTWDAAWQKERMPLPPHDFDIRFNNAAAPFLMAAEPLSGHETVSLTHLHREAGTVRFKLPGPKLITACLFRHETIKFRAAADTLLIEPDENRFTLVYRTAYRGPMPWPQLLQVTIHDENIRS